MKTAAFYGLLSLPIILWAVLFLPIYILPSSDLSTHILSSIVDASKIIGADISIFGEVTPAILAGAIIALSPGSKQNINLAAIFIAVLSYIFFLQLTIFFTSGQGAGVISATWDQPDEPRKALLGAISNIRTMTIVIAASIIGLKIKP